MVDGRGRMRGGTSKGLRNRSRAGAVDKRPTDQSSALSLLLRASPTLPGCIDLLESF